MLSEPHSICQVQGLMRGCCEQQWMELDSALRQGSVPYCGQEQSGGHQRKPPIGPMVGARVGWQRERREGHPEHFQSDVGTRRAGLRGLSARLPA